MRASEITAVQSIELSEVRIHGFDYLVSTINYRHLGEGQWETAIFRAGANLLATEQLLWWQKWPGRSQARAGHEAVAYGLETGVDYVQSTPRDEVDAAFCTCGLRRSIHFGTQRKTP